MATSNSYIKGTVRGKIFTDHAFLRLLLELDGEVVVNCIPDVGFLHTGIEKNMEAKTYEKAAVMTDRLDYLNNLGNNLVYCSGD